MSTDSPTYEWKKRSNYAPEGYFVCFKCYDTTHEDEAWECSHGDFWDMCQFCGDEDGCYGLLHVG